MAGFANALNPGAGHQPATGGIAGNDAVGVSGAGRQFNTPSQYSQSYNDVLSGRISRDDYLRATQGMTDEQRRYTDWGAGMQRANNPVSLVDQVRGNVPPAGQGMPQATGNRAAPQALTPAEKMQRDAQQTLQAQQARGTGVRATQPQPNANSAGGQQTPQNMGDMGILQMMSGMGNMNQVWDQAQNQFGYNPSLINQIMMPDATTGNPMFAPDPQAVTPPQMDVAQMDVAQMGTNYGYDPAQMPTEFGGNQNINIDVPTATAQQAQAPQAQIETMGTNFGYTPETGRAAEISGDFGYQPVTANAAQTGSDYGYNPANISEGIANDRYAAGGVGIGSGSASGMQVADQARGYDAAQADLAQAQAAQMGTEFGYDPAQIQGDFRAQAGQVGGARDAQAQQAAEQVREYQAAQSRQPDTIASGMDRYQNPYKQQVIDETMRQMERDREITQTKNDAAAAAAGAFGGSRHGLVESETNRNFFDKAGQVRAGLLDQMFGTSAALSGKDTSNRMQTDLANTTAINRAREFGAGGYNNLLGLDAQLATSTGVSNADRALRAGMTQAQLDTSVSDANAGRGLQQARDNMGAQNQASQFGQQLGFGAQQSNMQQQNAINQSNAQQANQVNLANAQLASDASRFGAGAYNELLGQDARLGTQASISNADNATRAGIAQGQINANIANQNAQRNLTADLSNADIMNQASQFGEGLRFEGGQADANRQQQMNLANMGVENDAARFGQQLGFDQAAINAGNNQQMNLANMGAINQANQFGEGLGYEAAARNMGAINAGNQANADRMAGIESLNARLGTDVNLANAGNRLGANMAEAGYDFSGGQNAADRYMQAAGMNMGAQNDANRFGQDLSFRSSLANMQQQNQGGMANMQQQNQGNLANMQSMIDVLTGNADRQTQVDLSNAGFGNTMTMNNVNQTNDMLGMNAQNDLARQLANQGADNTSRRYNEDMGYNQINQRQGIANDMFGMGMGAIDQYQDTTDRYARDEAMRQAMSQGLINTAMQNWDQFGQAGRQGLIDMIGAIGGQPDNRTVTGSSTPSPAGVIGGAGDWLFGEGGPARDWFNGLF